MAPKTVTAGFGRFGRLPPELRDEIWEFVLCIGHEDATRPRIINIEFTGRRAFIEDIPKWDAPPPTTAPSPDRSTTKFRCINKKSLLATSTAWTLNRTYSESRAVVQRRLARSTLPGLPGFGDAHLSPLLDVNPRRDLLFVRSPGAGHIGPGYARLLWGWELPRPVKEVVRADEMRDFSHMVIRAGDLPPVPQCAEAGSFFVSSFAMGPPPGLQSITVLLESKGRSMDFELASGDLEFADEFDDEGKLRRVADEVVKLSLAEAEEKHGTFGRAIWLWEVAGGGIKQMPKLRFARIKGAQSSAVCNIISL
ncbi:hypothetical protein B0T25DRAFT_513112 [Lasiosphaeria hispida]|uniref:2EXR domain-containing protein n=1 Tax=Lasiosphaeria hispida TaxID=260671 RepID=A0AAJ0HU88_9PEZI|nr:hypothetical protein B0T25DRAFT_513112 [Lasiosphaeria hispida]